MQPLKRRNSPTSPTEAQGIELLRASRAFAPTTGAKQRVRARLVGRGLGRRSAKLRPGVLVLAVTCIAGTSLAFSGGFLVRTYERLFEPTAEGSEVRQPRLVPAALQKPIDAASQKGAAPSALPGPSLPRPSETAGNEATKAPASVATAPVSVRSPTARSNRAKTARETPASDETRLVFDAMRALRHEGQPERASRLLDQYLSRFPAGPLAEEAMALSIEAKTRSGDPRAKDLATGYLERFPSGQFRAAAERVQARFAP